jgi:hypothetical protein
MPPLHFVKLNLIAAPIRGVLDRIQIDLATIRMGGGDRGWKPIPGNLQTFLANDASKAIDGPHID